MVEGGQEVSFFLGRLQYRSMTVDFFDHLIHKKPMLWKPLFFDHLIIPLSSVCISCHVTTRIMSSNFFHPNLFCWGIIFTLDCKRSRMIKKRPHPRLKASIKKRTPRFNLPSKVYVDITPFTEQPSSDELPTAKLSAHELFLMFTANIIKEEKIYFR